MRLNLNIIRENLPSHWTVRQFGPAQPPCTLNRTCFYEKNQTMEPQKLYVTPTSWLPTVPPSGSLSIVCTGTQLPMEWMYSNHSVLLILGEQDIHKISNAVSDIFHKYDIWKETLLSEMGKDADFDLKQILALGVSILGNPLMVVDPSLQIIYSSEITQNADGTCQISVSNTPFPLDLSVRASLKDTCEKERLYQKPFLSAMPTNDLSTYCQNLYVMDHFMGSIWLENKNRDFSESDFLIADYYFSIFTKAFQRYLHNFRQTESPISTALQKLLKHLPLLEEEQSALILQEEEVWFCFKLRHAQISKSMPIDYTVATLNTLLPEHICSIPDSSGITGLLRLSRQEAEEFCGPHADLFKELVNRMGYLAGLGNAFTDMEQFDEIFLQANFALEDAIQNHFEGTVHPFQEHILNYMLHECTGKLPLSTLTSKGIQSLMAYDCEKHTEHLTTLKVYLKNEMSVPRTSQELFIHRTSLLKRLKKIEKIIGCDLNNPEVRLYYRILFALLEKNIL